MIAVDMITENIIKITVPETLKAHDFDELTPKVDVIIRNFGSIRLLVDASHFHGWENTDAFEKHMGFVKSHHARVDRIAAIVAHHWMHWVIGSLRIFVHPEVQIFDTDQVEEAHTWITEDQQ